MALNTFVIINSITNLSDARYCAGMGVDVLGFTLEPGNDCTVSQATFKEITGWVAGVQLLAEFREMNVLEINQLAEENKLDFVLLHQNYTLGDIEKIEKPVILRILITGKENLADLRVKFEEYFAEVEYFMIDSEEFTEINNDTEHLLRDLANIYPIILSCGITAKNVTAVLHTIEPAGICLKGGSEIKPGLRDFDELAEILEVLQPEED